jgi:hypothetical protein
MAASGFGPNGSNDVAAGSKKGWGGMVARDIV